MTSHEHPPRPKLPESWLNVIGDEFKSPHIAQLKAFLVNERQQYTVYPPGRDMFNAFWLTPFDEVCSFAGSISWTGASTWAVFFSALWCTPSAISKNIFIELNQD